MKVKEIADYLQDELLKANFIVHRYNAYSTCSIYLKLDYGASNSIRISDHKGYDHLSYKYEVNQKFVKSGWSKDKQGFWRYHCKPDIENINNLIQLIIKDRNYKKCFYNYDIMIDKCKSDSKHSKGFWEKCEEVKLC